MSCIAIESAPTLLKANVMKTPSMALIAFLGFFLALGVAAASEEEILSARKVTISADGRKVAITADGRKAFGDVSATLETTTDGPDRIKSIILTVEGKTFVVPKEQFDNLRDPLIKTAEFRYEEGRGSGRLLYLTFQLATQDAKAASDRVRVYIRYQNGKLMDRSIRQPQK
jgi:hypothetical protein